MKHLILVLVLLIPLSLFAQRPRQIQVDAKFLEVNQDAVKELGFTFSLGGGVAFRNWADQEHKVPLPVPRISAGVEFEPLHGISFNPQISWQQNGSLEIGPTWQTRVRVNHIALQLETQSRVLTHGPWSYGLLVDPFFTFATCGKEYWEFNDVGTDFDVEFGNGYRRVMGHLGLGLSATAATDLGDFTFWARHTISYTPIFKDLPTLRDRTIQIGVTGKLFRNRDLARERQDIILFVKPTLVDPE